MKIAADDLSKRSVKELLAIYRKLLPPGACFFLGRDDGAIEEVRIPAAGRKVTFGFLEHGCPPSVLSGYPIERLQRHYPFAHHITSTSERFQEDLASHLRSRLAAARKRLLVVDDDPEICRVIAEMLEMMDFSVLTANSGREAVKLIDRSGDSIDVLLTDVVMPMLNGAELARIARFGHPAMRVIYMSGHPDTIVDRYGIAQSGIRCLRKPFSPAILEQVVRDELQNTCP